MSCIFENCVKAHEFRLKLRVSNHYLEFWESDAQMWLESNLKLSCKTYIENWKTIFCVACWFIWRWRKKIVHYGSCSSVYEGVTWAMSIVRCMMRAKKFLGGHGSFLRNGQLSQVVESGVKVFVDGAFSRGSSVVGSGGVIHDLEGNVLEAFMYSIYGSSSVEAELCGFL